MYTLIKISNKKVLKKNIVDQKYCKTKIIKYLHACQTHTILVQPDNKAYIILFDQMPFPSEFLPYICKLKSQEF